MPKFRVFSEDPSDPCIEIIDAHLIELDHLGNLIFRTEDRTGISVYATGSWYKVMKDDTKTK